MAKRSTRDSFILRVYRYDPEDKRRVTGLVEVTDGSGVTAPFMDTGELGAILNRLLGSRKKSRRGTKAQSLQKSGGESA